MPATIRTKGLVTALILGLTATGVSAQTATEETEAPAEAAESAPEAATEEAAPLVPGKDFDASTVMMTVGDQQITLGDLIAVRRTLPEQYQQLPGEVLMQALGDQLVSQVLLAAAARDKGLDKRPDIAMTLRTQEMGLLAQTYVRSQIRDQLTAEAIDAAYAEKYADAEPVEEVRAGHILVDSEEKAKELKAELDGGAEFADLAAKHGTDGTAQRGGDLGYFVHSDMVPEFADAAFAMEPGDISEPVQSPFGWHLIKLDDRRERGAPPIEEVRDDIVAELASKIEAEVYETVTQGIEVEKNDAAIPADAIKMDSLLNPEQ